LPEVRSLFFVESDEAGSGDESEEEPKAGPSRSSENGDRLETSVLSLGGGASSELLAIAALVKACQTLELQATADRKGKSPAKWNWTGVDIGQWDGIVDKFRSSLQSQWSLSSTLEIDFQQGDLLASDSTLLDLTRLFAKPDLVTILFTLTELLTQSRPSTFSLLRSLTQHTPAGTLLLVADSASDISEFEMGSSGRKWPIYMILDTILLGPPNAPSGDWECIRKEDSRWFRLAPGVGSGWPVKLENTRYWLRLYRRI
jgi:25S rRNA (uracil2843-N3)-methyltransferase